METVRWRQAHSDSRAVQRLNPPCARPENAARIVATSETISPYACGIPRPQQISRLISSFTISLGTISRQPDNI
eukprot:13972563-Heterocapsa_arctica.AAC.1